MFGSVRRLFPTQWAVIGAAMATQEADAAHWAVAAGLFWVNLKPNCQFLRSCM